MYQQVEYQTLENKPISCTFCGAQISGRTVENVDPKTKNVVKICKWQCARCGNLVRMGKLS